jgi:hypothetical protein
VAPRQAIAQAKESRVFTCLYMAVAGIEPGQGFHGVKIRVRRILSGDFLMMQKGGALRSVEAVTAQLQAGLARRKAALDAAAR